MNKLHRCLGITFSFGLSLLLVCACAAPPIVAPPAAPSATEVARESSPSPVSPTATIAQGKIRPSVLAGTWYPDDPDQLRQMVDKLLAEAETAEGTPIGLLVPHAGYVYSGRVTAAGFKQLEGKDVDVAVIISADHQEPISNPIAVYPEGGFQTPLGVVPVDADLAKALIAADSRITADPQAHAQEHVIEIELPFLQRVCPNCRIVPVLMGVDDDETVKALADALLKVLPGRRVVVIASSDLSHYPKAADAREIDSATLDAILTGDPARVRQTTADLMSRGYANLLTCACSEPAILVTMQVAKGLGADTISLLRYANSADADPSTADQAVGYGAVMFWRHSMPDLTPERQQELLGLARSTIAEYLTSGTTPNYQTSDPELLRPSGAFVTLKDAARGDLRGCIGNMQADKPLYQTVQAMAVAAATADPRFPALTPDELDRVKIEISVLSPMRRLDDVKNIEIGKHGLLIDYQGQRGVFLPQVPVEQGWNREQYLDNLCQKAGLFPGCWRDKAAVLYTFTAEVFGEDESR
jgi:AmmeMemoRadiSam system protein B/AmmeMemoRadiSam system protein A